MKAHVYLGFLLAGVAVAACGPTVYQDSRTPFVGYGDAAEQARQAMANIKTLLEEAGSGLGDICKITTYLADRADRESVYQVVGQTLRGVFPVGTGLIVDGFANPRILVEIDAVLRGN